MIKSFLKGIEGDESSTQGAAVSRFVRMLSVFLDEIGALEVLAVNREEDLEFVVHIVDHVDSIFALEALVFEAFIETVGVFLAQATEMERFSDALVVHFISNFHNEGVVAGKITVTGDGYRLLSSQYEKKFHTLPTLR